MPLVWHILNIKLRRQGQLAHTRTRLGVYLAALNSPKERYEGVDRVLQHIRQVDVCVDSQGILRSVEALDSQYLDNFNPGCGEGVDTLTSLPQFLLRTMVTVQLALAHGKYPEEHELPPQLASSAGSNAQSTCKCVLNEKWHFPSLGDDFDAIVDVIPLTACPNSTNQKIFILMAMFYESQTHWQPRQISTIFLTFATANDPEFDGPLFKT